MACNKPFFKYISSHNRYEIIPCGFCAGCRKDRITMWCMRVNGEVLYYDYTSTFLTLTYDDQHLPFVSDCDATSTLNYNDVSSFWKMYRKENEKQLNLPFKYLLTGEYGYSGERLVFGGNPHYHALVIGHSADYVEKLCNKVWTKGFNRALPLLDGGTRYVCKYIDKQVSIKQWNMQCIQERPALRCSQGIGVRYFVDHLDSIRANGGIFDRGILRPIPKYYIDKFELEIKHSPEYERKVARLNSCMSNIRHGSLDISRVRGIIGDGISEESYADSVREYNLLWKNTRRTRKHEVQT